MAGPTRDRPTFAYQPIGYPADAVHFDRRRPPTRRHPSGRSGRSAWHWLLWLPVVLPLITPLYNRTEPRWSGIPFFYWFQLSLIGLDIAVLTLVYLATRRRGVP